MQLLLLSSPLPVFMSARISASVVLSDQYLSSQAVISDHDQIDLIAITLLFTCCFFPPLFLCCCPLFFSLSLTCCFSPIHSVFVSLSSSIIMFHTLVIALPLWAHILAGHTAFLLTSATYTITLERGRVRKNAKLSCIIMTRVRLKGARVCLLCVNESRSSKQTVVYSASRGLEEVIPEYFLRETVFHQKRPN